MNLREELLNKSNSSFELITTHVMMELIEQARQELIDKKVMLCQMCGTLSLFEKCCGNVHTTPIIAFEEIDKVLGEKEGK